MRAAIARNNRIQRAMGRGSSNVPRSKRSSISKPQPPFLSSFFVDLCQQQVNQVTTHPPLPFYHWLGPSGGFSSLGLSAET